MAKPEIILTRHGECTDNEKGILNGHRDTSLTQRGIRQAGEVGEQLKGEGINIIFSSPLRRAKKTAKIIFENIEANEIKINDLLIERHLGILTGKPTSKIPDYAEEIIEVNGFMYFLQTERAEKVSDCYQRANRFLQNLNGHKDKTILLVTHGGIGQMIRAAYHGWSWREGLHAPHLDNTEMVRLNNKR